MLDFRAPALDDQARIEAFVRRSGQIGCDVTFVNTFLWRNRYDIRVAFTDDAYYKCYFTAGALTGYTFPMTAGDPRAAVDRILDDARERGIQPLIGLLNDRNAELIRSWYGERVRIEEDRDSFDYLYDREALATLSGKKYHAKRNHLSRFYRTYGNYSVEEIKKENFSDVMSVAKRWQQGTEDTGELRALRDALMYYERLGLFGVLLYVDGRAVAMSMGSRISDDVCDVNFEKAVDIDEAYAVINNEFAKRFDSFRVFNREEDLGVEGLRKSKLSYHPSALLCKSTAYFK